MSHNTQHGGARRRRSRRRGKTGVLSGRPLPDAAAGRHRHALAVTRPRAQEGRDQQAAGGVRQHLVCEVERRRSQNPPSVRHLLSGSPVAGGRDHADVSR